MLTRASRRGQALLIVLAFIAAFALILWATAFFASGSFLAQRSTISDTKTTYTVDAALQWGLAYVRLNPPACTSGPLTPAIPSPGPAVNGVTPTLTITPDATCTSGTPVFNLVATAGPRSGQAQVVHTTTPIIYVQGNRAGNVGSASVTRAFSSSVTASNTIVVAVVGVGASASSVTDTAGNTYTKAVGNNANPDGTEVSIWYAANVRGGAVTVTASFTGVADNNAIAIHEYSGLLTSAPLDRTAGRGGESASPSSGATAATTQASELVFGATGDAAQATTFTAGTGFTLRQSLVSGTFSDIATEDKTVSATGAQTATFTANQSVAWSCVVATFKGAGGGAWSLNSYGLQ